MFNNKITRILRIIAILLILIGTTYGFASNYSNRNMYMLGGRADDPEAILNDKFNRASNPSSREDFYNYKEGQELLDKLNSEEGYSMGGTTYRVKNGRLYFVNQAQDTVYLSDNFYRGNTSTLFHSSLVTMVDITDAFIDNFIANIIISFTDEFDTKYHLVKDITFQVYFGFAMIINIFMFLFVSTILQINEDTTGRMPISVSESIRSSFAKLIKRVAYIMMIYLFMSLMPSLNTLLVRMGQWFYVSLTGEEEIAQLYAQASNQIYAINMSIFGGLLKIVLFVSSVFILLLELFTITVMELFTQFAPSLVLLALPLVFIITILHENYMKVFISWVGLYISVLLWKPMYGVISVFASIFLKGLISASKVSTSTGGGVFVEPVAYMLVYIFVGLVVTFMIGSVPVLTSSLVSIGDSGFGSTITSIGQKASMGAAITGAMSAATSIQKVGGKSIGMATSIAQGTASRLGYSTDKMIKMATDSLVRG